MENAKELARRVEEVFLNGTWIANTNYQQATEGLTVTDVLQKINNANSIALLVFHINYYLEGLLKAFTHHELTISDRFSFDMQPLKREQDWVALRNRFLKNAQAFVVAVSEMSDERLDEDFIDAKYGSFRRNIEGVIEHSYYHLGQIVMLRKFIHS